MRKLTDSYIKSLKEPGVYRDGLLTGFLIRCGRRVKAFELRIVRKDRPKIFATIGHWPQMTEKEARLKAIDILARHERGVPNWLAI